METDQLFGVTVDADWIVHLTGGTDSQNLQRKQATQEQLNGGKDAFIARLNIVPTLTPMPTPTPIPPTPTPTPFASGVIGPEGGALWIASPQHITVLDIPKDALHADTPITLTHESQGNPQGDLQGLNHFFSIYAELKSSSTWMPLRFLKPAQVTVGYKETCGAIADTINLYRLTANGWKTDTINIIKDYDGYMIANIEWMGIYGLLGETNRTYLPTIVRQ
jgi:hypothetical protein